MYALMNFPLCPLPPMLGYKMWSKVQTLLLQQMHYTQSFTSGQRVSLCVLWICGDFVTQLRYEGWNFNSDNYLFTTDTK